MLHKQKLLVAWHFHPGSRRAPERVWGPGEETCLMGTRCCMIAICMILKNKLLDVGNYFGTRVHVSVRRSLNDAVKSKRKVVNFSPCLRSGQSGCVRWRWAAPRCKICASLLPHQGKMWRLSKSLAKYVDTANSRFRTIHQEPQALFQLLAKVSERLRTSSNSVDAVRSSKWYLFSSNIVVVISTHGAYWNHSYCTMRVLVKTLRPDLQRAPPSSMHPSASPVSGC